VIKITGSLIPLVRDNGAILRVLDEAKAYVDKAAKCRGIFSASSTKEKLLGPNGYIVERRH
jgi:hypothetical protein